jgi:Cu+-exporting ATPase
MADNQRKLSVCYTGSSYDHHYGLSLRAGNYHTHVAAIAGGKAISIGLLVKASEVFYGLSKVNTLVFDKTGTLTHGKPTVTDYVSFNVTEEELLSLAGSVEENSEHPLAQAIHF